MRSLRIPHVRALSMVTNTTPPSFEYEFKTLVEMQVKTCDINSRLPVFGTKDGKSYTWISYLEMGNLVTKYRTVLRSFGVRANQRVGLIANNRVEWAVAYYAANSLGAQVVPMYEQQTERDWKYIVKDSDMTMLLVATQHVLSRTKSYVNTVGSLKNVLCFDATSDSEHSIQRWITATDRDPPVACYMPHEEDISAIVYTSGTTGKPKASESLE